MKQLNGKWEVTLRFETLEDIPEEFQEVAQKLVETQDLSLVPARENFVAMMEAEFDAFNVELVEMKVVLEEVEEEVESGE